MMAFDDYSQDMRTYRVDRMKDIRFTGEPRDGEEVFKQIDLKTYTKRVFYMYGGEQRLVEIRFINPEIDIIIFHHQAADTKAMPRLLRGRADASGKHIQRIDCFLQRVQQFYSGLRLHPINGNIACNFLQDRSARGVILTLWTAPPTATTGTSCI